MHSDNQIRPEQRLRLGSGLFTVLVAVNAGLIPLIVTLLVASKSCYALLSLLICR